MELIGVSVGIELEHTSYDKGYHSETSEPPCNSDACCETGYDKEYKSDRIEYYRQCFHNS